MTSREARRGASQRLLRSRAARWIVIVDALAPGWTVVSGQRVTETALRPRCRSWIGWN